MKKKYRNPELTVISIQTQQMIAGSDFGKEKKDGSLAASRRGTSWEEEEDYEDFEDFEDEEDF